MTRKDFEALAAVIKAGRTGDNDDYADKTARSTADMLATTNPRFDRDRFLKACGVK